MNTSNSEPFVNNILSAIETIETEDLILWLFVLVLICLGVLLNLLVMRSMLSIKFNGTHYLLLQIIITDLISLIEVKWEVFYVNHRSWLDPIEWCPIYLGIEAFTGTALVFFIIAMNLHSISTHNLACKTIAKSEIAYYETQTLRNTSEDDSLDDDEFDEFDEIDSNCDSIVSMEPTEKNPRSIVIDYCKKKSQISVFQPIICIWLLAISMCIPLFIFGRIIPTLNRSSNERMCGLIVMEKNTTTILQILLLKMRIIVPMFCLFLSTIYVIIKLKFTKIKTSKVLSVEKEVDDKLKLALSLSLIYILCSMQRIYGSLWFELISRPMMEYKYAQFHRWLGVAGCFIHYASTILRPIMYARYDTDLKERCCYVCARS